MREHPGDRTAHIALEVERDRDGLRRARRLTDRRDHRLDHGIEPTAQRLACGKPARAQLVLTTELRGGELVVEIRDDGRGIDGSAVTTRAAAMGLPIRTPRELADALFASGLSTAPEITETSGRGLGMSALRATCSELGGRVELLSEPGAGTTVRCCVPIARSRPARGRCSPGIPARPGDAGPRR